MAFGMTKVMISLFVLILLLIEPKVWMIEKEVVEENYSLEED